MTSPPSPFDLDLLRAFVAVAESGGFSRAAHRLGRSQSTVSLQIKRLETVLGRTVLARVGGSHKDAHLTPDGEILLRYARDILALCDEAHARLGEASIAGTVRLGTPEDFATTHLPDVLAEFAITHPRVALEVTCDFTVNLLDGFAKGRYDLVLFKREPQKAPAQAPDGGVGVWREVLIWVAGTALPVSIEDELPLVLAPAPDVYRRRAIAALEAGGWRWRVAYTSQSLAGLQAAVRAGLGVTVLPREMATPGLVTLDEKQSGLPHLPDTEIVLFRAPGKPPYAAQLLGTTLSRLWNARAERNHFPKSDATREVWPLVTRSPVCFSFSRERTARRRRSMRA